jgi:hypothetical protein
MTTLVDVAARSLRKISPVGVWRCYDIYRVNDSGFPMTTPTNLRFSASKDAQGSHQYFLRFWVPTSAPIHFCVSHLSLVNGENLAVRITIVDSVNV